MARQTSPLCRFFLVLFLSSIAPALCEASYAEDVLLRVCRYTRFPDYCVDAVSTRTEPPTLESYDVAGVATDIVLKVREELRPIFSLFSLERAEDSGARREATVYCGQLMEMSLVRLNQSMNALQTAPAEKKEDILTWLTAVLTFQETCKDSLGEAYDPLYGIMERLTALSSIVLAIAHRIPDVSRTRFSENHFPAWVSNIVDRPHLARENMKAAAVVALDGSGNFTSIKEALASLSSRGGRTVILVKAGIYKEKLTISRADVTLVGEGKRSTVITFASSVRKGASMPETATVVVTGDRFVAKNIAFENSAGPGGGQAVALRVLSDRAALFRCSVRGYQDTLYAQAFRQFYRGCDIHGTVDFIFGNAAAVFQNCNLILRKPTPGAYNVIMASGRTDPYQNSGFVAQNCRIRAGPDLSSLRHSVRSYLGRPWKKYARAIVMQSFIDDCVHHKGWVEKAGGFGTRTLYFAEGLNRGPGARTSGRVSWPGFHVIRAGECSKFTVSSFIQGTSWLPPAGVAYQPGL